MSERFVRGWKVSPEKLLGLVGSQRWSAAEVLESEANAPCREDVLASLGRGDEGRGKEVAASALCAILEGRLEPGRVYDYARVTELLLNHVGRPLAKEYVAGQREPLDQILLRLTYAVPNESHARWNPLLDECDVPVLASAWGAPNLAFPWREGEGPDRGKWPWPLWTVLGSSDLPKVAAELAGLTKERMSAIPAAIVADDVEWVEDSREELWEGLQRLRAWVDASLAPEETEGPAWTRSGNALVLLMDGDQ